MRLLVSFAGGLLVALALFALMIALVMPPRDNREPTSELARISFVRSVSDTQSDARQRQPREAPERPQPPEVPQPPSVQQPRVDSSMQLNIAVPNLPRRDQHCGARRSRTHRRRRASGGAPPVGSGPGTGSFRALTASDAAGGYCERPQRA